MNCKNNNCLNEHDGSFGSGVFCSRSCANSRTGTKERRSNISKGMKASTKIRPPISEETRKKLSDAAKITNARRVYKRKDIEEYKSFTWVRERIFEERDRVCEECGWDTVNPFNGFVPVQVDHIDGDRTNNTRENLKVLCPNCHSMTEKFMFYNGKHTKESRDKIKAAR